MPPEAEETVSPEADQTVTMPPQEDATTTMTTISPFHSCGFKDVTERIFKVLLDKAIVHPKVGHSYFGWKGVGFQVGVCFCKPPLVDLSFAACFLSIHQSISDIPHQLRKSPPEQLLARNLLPSHKMHKNKMKECHQTNKMIHQTKMIVCYFASHA